MNIEAKTKTMPKTLPQWNAYVGEALTASAVSILEAGRRMYEFKQNCETKKGGSKFSSHVETFWHMSPNTALKWAKIGESVQLQSRDLALPSTLYALYELATLGAKDFTRANKEGLISTETTREQILNFKKRLKLENNPPKPKPEKPEPTEPSEEPDDDYEGDAGQNDILQAIETLAKYAMQAAHPDKGGSTDAFIQVSEAKTLLEDMFA